MNGSRYILAIALAACLFLIRPLDGTQGYPPPPLTLPVEEKPVDPSIGTYGPSAQYSDPEEKIVQDGEGIKPANSHAIRVGPWSSSPMSGPVSKPPIAHFGTVEEGILYRSAQPNEAELRWLKDQGFKSIVSFRREAGDHTGHMLDVGFKNTLWLNIGDETAPSDAQAERFLDFVTNSDNWPVLIHCKVGLGRTGTMAALVRYAVDRWTMEHALEEARLYRGGKDLVPDQVAWLKRWAANHPPGCHRPLLPQSQ